MRKISISVMALIALMLAACSPTYNWRDYSSPDASFKVQFPAKPATYTRTVDLDGMKVDMTMTAAEVEETMFAVGTAEAPDPQRAQAALAAMQAALVRNIGGTITKETVTATASSPSVTGTSATRNIEATGTHNGTSMRLIGHFEARGKRIYQVIVMGKAQSITPEQVEQFLSSFKPR